MNPQEAINARHSVRAYVDRPIPETVRQELNVFVENCNRKAKLSVFIQYDDPDANHSRRAHY